MITIFFLVSFISMSFIDMLRNGEMYILKYFIIFCSYFFAFLIFLFYTITKNSIKIVRKYYKKYLKR
jgi:hypothetical protein